jgi:hypothetical protein
MTQIISTAYLMGGLGNQMFQMSHAICQGWKNNIPSKFSPSSETIMQGNQPTKYLNNLYRNIEFTNDIPNTKRIKSGWSYTDINPSWETSVEFFGYFQSSKNFLGYDEKIKELFQPTGEFINKIKTLYPEINNEGTISLHIRRGDYTTISHVLPVIDKTYIDESLKQNGGYTTLFIFSDDVKWVNQHLSYPNQIIVTGLEDYEEMWFMSLCENNIMSNSTFSWWGSFLNKNKNKNVFLPSVWFGPSGEHNWDDIYIDSWKRINVKYLDGKLMYNKRKTLYLSL